MSCNAERHNDLILTAHPLGFTPMVVPDWNMSADRFHLGILVARELPDRSDVETVFMQICGEGMTNVHISWDDP